MLERPGSIRSSIELATGRRSQLEQERFQDLGSDLWVITGSDGRFQWVSQPMARLLGRTVEEMVSRPWTEFVHPDDLGLSVQETGDLFGGKITIGFENRYKHTDGRLIWLKWNARTYPLENLIYAVAVDITGQKIQEGDQQFLMEMSDTLSRLSDPQEMMRRIGNGLRSYLGLARCVFVDLDLASDTAAAAHVDPIEGSMPFSGTHQISKMVSPEMFFDLQKGLQLAISDVATDRRTKERAGMYAALNIGASMICPFVSDGICRHGIIVHHHNAHDWTDREVKLLKEISTRAWSAIERARIAQRLQHSRDRLRLVTDALPALVSYLDKDHVYRFVNRSYTEWFGINKEEIVGRHLKDIVGDKVYAASLPNVDRVLSGETVQFEQVHEYKHGGTRYVQVSFVPDISDHGTVHGWYAFVQDISERKENEEERKVADRRKDEFLATLSHELRNPLSPLKSALEILDLPVSAQEAHQARKIMGRQLDRITRLVDDLMDLSRITRNKVNLQKRIIDLNQVVVSAIEATAPMMKAERHTLSIHLSKEPLFVNGDEDRMVQVITNLLTNACKFTDRGSTIEVITQLDGAWASVQVKDPGIGLAADQLDRIFEMFGQVESPEERRTSGLGIGLNLVRNLVGMHDGTVTAESEGPGKGSTFTIRIPIAIPSA